MNGGGRRGRRTLSETERALWEQVTRGVSPLAPDRTPPSEAEVAAKAAGESAAPANEGKSAAGRKAKPGETPRRVVIRPAPAEPPHRGPPDIDRRTRRRLAKGTERIEARIDLHGMFQEDAYRRLRAFLASAQADGLAHVLVITGKGRGTADAGERGVLRRAVPEWLRQPAFHRYVAGFGPAHHVHGGEGAIYVRIRRRAR